MDLFIKQSKIQGILPVPSQKSTYSSFTFLSGDKRHLTSLLKSKPTREEFSMCVLTGVGSEEYQLQDLSQ